MIDKIVLYLMPISFFVSGYICGFIHAVIKDSIRENLENRHKKTGHWIVVNSSDLQCSNCGDVITKRGYHVPYCHCGAKMNEDRE